MSLLEATAGLSLTTIVLIVAVPILQRELRASHQAEARDTLLRIGAAAATYAQVPKHRHGLPESIARTPAEVPRGTPVVVDAEAWAPWGPLMAEVVPPGFPQRYAYSFVRIAGDHAAFDAAAEGDLDGDGVLSRATLHGAVDASGRMQLAPDVEFIDALE